MLNQGGLKPAMERIQFQKESALFKDLTKAYQNTLDALDKHFGERKASSEEILRALEKTNMIKDVQDAAYKHLNVHVQVIPIDIPSPNMFMLTNMKKNPELLQEYMRRADLSEGRKTQYRSPSQAANDIIRELGQTIDINKGTYPSAVGSVLYNQKIGIATGFFNKHNPSREIEPFTAKELAAVTLHELGHIILIPYDAQKTYRSATIIHDAFDYLRSDNVSKKEREKATMDIADKITDIYSKKNAHYTGLTPKDAAETENAVSNFKQAMMSPTLFFGGFGIVSVLVIFLQFALLFIIGSFFYRMYKYIRKEIEGGHESLKSLSDEGKSYKDGTAHERSADEFATRHGAGLHLVSAFYKIDQSIFLENHNGTAYPSISISTTSAMDWVLMIMPRIILSSKMEASSFFPYETSSKRIKRVLETNMAFFKQTNIPKAILKDWIEDTQNLKKKIEEMEKKPYIKYHAAMTRVIKKLSIYHTIDTFKDANLKDDLDILQDATSGLIRNPFYYQSARIKHQ